MSTTEPYRIIRGGGAPVTWRYFMRKWILAHIVYPVVAWACRWFYGVPAAYLYARNNMHRSRFSAVLLAMRYARVSAQLEQSLHEVL